MPRSRFDGTVAHRRAGTVATLGAASASVVWHLARTGHLHDVLRLARTAGGTTARVARRVYNYFRGSVGGPPRVPSSNIARSVGTKSGPVVGLIDHKTRRAKFVLYQSYTLGSTQINETPIDIAIPMVLDEFMHIYKDGMPNENDWYARTPSFHNMAQHWMTFTITGMKMVIGTLGERSFLQGEPSVSQKHTGGAWSTAWNLVEADSHKPIDPYADTVTTSDVTTPRWRFQKEARWLDATYRASRFRFVNELSRERAPQRRHRFFYSRYVQARAPVLAGFGANGISVRADARHLLPRYDCHQPNQALQYQANQVTFTTPENIFRSNEYRVKKTWYVVFADKRERRNIDMTPMKFRPVTDECRNVGQIASIGYCARNVAGAPRVGPVAEPKRCSEVGCAETCEPLVCPPGEIYTGLTDEFGCPSECAPGTLSGGAPCFDTTTEMALNTCRTAGSDDPLDCNLGDPVPDGWRCAPVLPTSACGTGQSLQPATTADVPADGECAAGAVVAVCKDII